MAVSRGMHWNVHESLNRRDIGRVLRLARCCLVTLIAWQLNFLFRGHVGQVFGRCKPRTTMLCYKELPLLDEESNSLFLLLRGMTTVSFCRPSPPPLRWLQRRLTAVVEKNPWLGGKLRRVEESVRLCFSEEVLDERNLALSVEVVEPMNITSSTPYEVISQRISGSPAEVRSGLVCLENSSEPLLRGQSAARFGRSRQLEELEFLRKVAARAVQEFGGPRKIDALVLAGSANMKFKLVAELPPPLRRNIAGVLTLNCNAGWNGLEKVVAQIPGVMKKQAEMSANSLAGEFLRCVQDRKDAELLCYGEAETAKAFELGAVKLLVVSDMHTNLQRWLTMASSHGVDARSIAASTPSTSQFCEGYQIGAFLRWPAQLSPEEDCTQFDSDCEVHSDSEASTAAPSMSEALPWLQHALLLAGHDEASAEALAIGVDLVLSHDMGTPEERFNDALELLQGADVPNAGAEKKFCIWKLSTLCEMVQRDGKLNEFALVVSISHIIADGHTYYKLFSMLTQDIPVVSLNPSRKLHFHRQRLAAVGESEYDFIYSPGYVLNCLGSKVLYGRPRCRAYLVDAQKMNDVKVREAETHHDLSFVSTNDVLTSVFARLIAARVCSMAVNFRHRLPGILEEDAGNYQASSPQGSPGSKSPSGAKGSTDSRAPSRCHGAPKKTYFL
ncbi:unnamed protein product [Durusdinium trenchii]|uniref:eRF1 domain-containing protein n=1 Tax=Durusdinium trenchii TaxID=1381693 RepID=A0ABP0SL36_9DINO